MKGVLPSPSFREAKTASVMAAAVDAHRHETDNSKMKVKAAVGCLPGILFFFQRHHHSHSRKRLASGSRSDKGSTPTATPPQSPNPKPAPDKNNITAAAPLQNLKRVAGAGDLRRTSSRNDDDDDQGYGGHAAPKPSLPQELRLQPTRLVFASPPTPDVTASATTPRSGTTTTSTCRSPALVARLMGLDGLPPPPQPPVPTESASEKRRKLLTALEKCDEDLQALRKIIEALRIAEVRNVATAVAGTAAAKPAPRRKGTTAAAAAADQAAALSTDQRRSKKTATKPKPEKLHLLLQQPDQEPSPVSVLGPGHQLPPFGSPVRTRDSWHEKRRMFIGEGWPLLSGMTIPRTANLWASSRWIQQVAPPMYIGPRWRRACGYGNSKGMMDSVGEVCEEGLWEKRWERGRVGIMMEGDIFWDLVDELVEDMVRICDVKRLLYVWPSSLPQQCCPRLPYDACRRRLRF